MKKQTEIKYRERRCKNSFVPKKLKEAFGWRLVNVAEKTKSWLAEDGSSRAITKKYCIMHRVTPYSRNLIFRLTELLANIFNFLRGLLWVLLIPIIILAALLASDFTADIMATFMPFGALQLCSATLIVFAVVYAGCYLLILLGWLERKLFGIDKRYAARNYAAQSGSLDLKVDIRIVQDGWSLWRNGAKRAKAFGWKVYDDVKVSTEAVFSNWAENQQRIARNEARAEEFAQYTREVAEYELATGMDYSSLVDFKRKELEMQMEALDDTVESRMISSYYTALIRPVEYKKSVKILEKLDHLFLLVRNFALIALGILLFCGITSYSEFSLLWPIPAFVFVAAVVVRTLFVIISSCLRRKDEEAAWCEALNLPVQD